MFAYIGFQLEDSYLTNAQKWCRAEELQEERRDKCNRSEKHIYKPYMAML